MAAIKLRILGFAHLPGAMLYGCAELKGYDDSTQQQQLMQLLSQRLNVDKSLQDFKLRRTSPVEEQHSVILVAIVVDLASDEAFLQQSYVFVPGGEEIRLFFYCCVLFFFLFIPIFELKKYDVDTTR